MSKCDWCGKEITGEPVLNTQEACLLIRDKDMIVEITPEYVAHFCCSGCVWAFAAETHRLMGFFGKELRTHLINMHRLKYPPGKPKGGMSRDCMVIKMAERLASVFSVESEKLHLKKSNS